MSWQHDRQFLAASLSGLGLSASEIAFGLYVLQVEPNATAPEVAEKVRRDIKSVSNGMFRYGLFARIRSKRRQIKKAEK